MLELALKKKEKFNQFGIYLDNNLKNLQLTHHLCLELVIMKVIIILHLT
jgi:hypothetical protein